MKNKARPVGSQVVLEAHAIITEMVVDVEEGEVEVKEIPLVS